MIPLNGKKPNGWPKWASSNEDALNRAEDASYLYAGTAVTYTAVSDFVPA